jgi:hypothetical protein
VSAIVWIALSYRLPREPTRLRLAVWRRLKGLGAVLLHDAVWLLPAAPDTREAFEWLAEEIEEQGGTAFLWEATSLGSAQDRTITAQFRAESDERYAAIAESATALSRLAARRRPLSGTRLDQARRQLAGLERALRLEVRRDHFRAGGRRGAEEAVRAAGGALTIRPRSGDRAHAVGH